MTPDRARELLESISGVRVLVVGDLMLDRTVSGTFKIHEYDKVFCAFYNNKLLVQKRYEKEGLDLN